MRIGITGSFEVGKSALAKALAEELNLPLITDMPTQVRAFLEIDKSLFHAIREESPFAYSAFQWELLRQQINREADFHRGFVSDNTTLDNYVHYIINDNGDHLPLKEAYRKLALLENFMTAYDYVIYIPVMVPAREDYDERIIAYRNYVDRKIAEFVASRRDVYVVKSAYTDEQVKEVLEFIRG